MKKFQIKGKIFLLSIREIAITGRKVTVLGMSKKIGAILLAGLLCCTAGGCMVKTADTKAVMDTLLVKEREGEQSVYIGGDDTFTDVIAESFQEDYYSLEELETMITEEITAYNEQNPQEEGTAMKMVSLEVEEEEAVLFMNYSTWEALSSYSAEEEFLDAQLSSAVMTETDTLTGSFVNAEGEAEDAEAILKKAAKKKYHKIAAEGTALTIYLERPIVCVSDNVTIVDEYTVQVTADESIIITR